MKTKSTLGTRRTGVVADFANLAYEYVAARLKKDPSDPVASLTDSVLIRGLIRFGPSPTTLVDLMYSKPQAKELEVHVSLLGRQTEVHAAEIIEKKLDSESPLTVVAPVKPHQAIWLTLLMVLTALTLALTVCQDLARVAQLEAQNKSLSSQLRKWESFAPDFDAKLAADRAIIASLNSRNVHQLDEIKRWEASAPRFQAKFVADNCALATLTAENERLKSALSQHAPARFEP